MTLYNESKKGQVLFFVRAKKGKASERVELDKGYHSDRD